MGRPVLSMSPAVAQRFARRLAAEAASGADDAALVDAVLVDVHAAHSEDGVLAVLVAAVRMLAYECDHDQP